MKRTFLSVVTILLTISVVGMAIFASTQITQKLPVEWSDFQNENDFEIGPEIPHLEDSNNVFWHFVANQLTETQQENLEIFVVFEDGEGTRYEKTLSSYKTAGKMNHYGIYTPYDFILVEAYTKDNINGQFNLSHVATAPTSEPTTTEPTTSEPTTTEPTTSEPTTTEPTTSEPTTTEPTTSETSEPTTEPTTTDEIPKTGQSGEGQWPIVGVILLGLSVALAALLRKSVKNNI